MRIYLDYNLFAYLHEGTNPALQAKVSALSDRHEFPCSPAHMEEIASALARPSDTPPLDRLAAAFCKIDDVSRISRNVQLSPTTLGPMVTKEGTASRVLSSGHAALSQRAGCREERLVYAGLRKEGVTSENGKYCTLRHGRGPLLSPGALASRWQAGRNQSRGTPVLRDRLAAGRRGRVADELPAGDPSLLGRAGGPRPARNRFPGMPFRTPQRPSSYNVRPGTPI